MIDKEGYFNHLRTQGVKERNLTLLYMIGGLICLERALATAWNKGFVDGMRGTEARLDQVGLWEKFQETADQTENEEA